MKAINLKLSEMQPGDIAVSKDKDKLFVCGHFYDKEKDVNKKVVLDLQNLLDQYSDKWDMDQPVRRLRRRSSRLGDKFVVEIREDGR